MIALVLFRSLLAALTLAVGRPAPDVAPTPVPVEAADVALVAAPAPPTPPPGPPCDQWCSGISAANQAAAQGDMVGVITAAAAAYGVPELAGWGVATARCESNLNPVADSGYYLGLFQHDPFYWPDRAAAAGFAGASPLDPVANAATSMWMRSAGMGAQHWPVCGR